MHNPLNVVLVWYLLMATSCTTDVPPEAYLDFSAPLSLIIQTNNVETVFTQRQTETLEVNSKKWTQLMEWAKRHRAGWTSTPASYAGDIYVTQGKFRLTHSIGSEGVVIAFVDTEGNGQQYQKSIPKGELDFLYAE